MRVVIDTNIIFSALLRSNSRELEILENQSHNVFYCQLSTIEIFKHKDKLVTLSNLSEEEIISNYYQVLKHLRPVYEKEIPFEMREQAVKLCGNLDVEYVDFSLNKVLIRKGKGSKDSILPLRGTTTGWE